VAFRFFTSAEWDEVPAREKKQVERTEWLHMAGRSVTRKVWLHLNPKTGSFDEVAVITDSPPITEITA
jgi:hypothetical protein